MTHHLNDPDTKHTRWTPDQDAALMIAKIPSRSPTEVAKVMQKVRPGVTAIQAMARWRNLIKNGGKSPKLKSDWTSAEIKILVKASQEGANAGSAHIRLRAAGYHRTKAAVLSRISKLRHQGKVPRRGRIAKNNVGKRKPPVKLLSGTVRVVFISERGHVSLIVDQATAKKMVNIGTKL